MLPVEVRRKIDELSRLLDDEQYDKAAPMLENLEDQLGPDDPAIIRARWILHHEPQQREAS